MILPWYCHNTEYLLRDDAAQLQDGAVTRDGQVLHWRYLKNEGVREGAQNVSCDHSKTWAASRDLNTNNKQPNQLQKHKFRHVQRA